MFAIQNNNISLTRGDTAIFRLVIKTADGMDYAVSGSDSVLFTVKRSTRDKFILIQKNAVQGVITLYPEDTADLPYGVYWYDVELKRSDGFTATVITPHSLRITEEVTF